jgi:hypothetical protein
VQLTIQMARETVVRLAIAMDDSSVTITSDLGQSLRLHTDGRKLDQEMGQGWKTETRACWNGRQLLVEREVDRGGKLTERYFRPSVTDQLYVVTQIENGRLANPVTFRRVYDLDTEP